MMNFMQISELRVIPSYRQVHSTYPLRVRRISQNGLTRHSRPRVTTAARDCDCQGASPRKGETFGGPTEYYLALPAPAGLYVTPPEWISDGPRHIPCLHGRLKCTNQPSLFVSETWPIRQRTAGFAPKAHTSADCLPKASRRAATLKSHDASAKA